MSKTRTMPQKQWFRTFQHHKLTPFVFCYQCKTAPFWCAVLEYTRYIWSNHGTYFGQRYYRISRHLTNCRFGCSYETILYQTIRSYHLQNYFTFSLLAETPWPLHMHEITGFGLVDLLDCTLHLHQQW